MLATVPTNGETRELRRQFELCDEFEGGVSRKTLELDGNETIDIGGLDDIRPGMTLTARIIRADGSSEEITLKCRIDTADEADYFRHGGILHYVLREIAQAA